MSIRAYTPLWACFVLLCGCAHPEKTHEHAVGQKEPSGMIRILDLTVGEKTLTLDYRVSNPFEDDIWVCHDTWVYGKPNVQDVTTRIDGETVWIKLRLNIENTLSAFTDPQAIAKYVRLQAGESCSGRILLDLPVRDYSREQREGVEEQKQTSLHRAVFEIGYIGAFGPKWERILASWAEKFKRESIKPSPKVIGQHYYLPVNPLITEETLDGQLREVMYLQEHTSLEEKEESAKVLITDVNILCASMVDDN